MDLFPFPSDTIAGKFYWFLFIVYVAVRLIIRNMTYEDLEQSVYRGMIGSVVIMFFGVSYDGWGQSLGCSAQVWNLIRGWAILAFIIALANYLVALWTNFNGGVDGWFGLGFGQQNNDDNDNPGDNPRRPPSGGNPPCNPPASPKKPPGGGGGNPPKSPTPQPRSPSPCPSPTPRPRRPPSCPRNPTPEPEPEKDICMVCGFEHPGGSHQW